MAIFSNRRDGNGTHIISGGHSSSDTSGKRALPFERRPESINLHLQAVGDQKNRLFTGSNNIYKLNGSFDMTVPNTTIVLVNGMPLNDSDYQINVEDKTITISRWIKPSDDDLEVRSQEDTNFTTINNVLILEVTPGFIGYDDLQFYTPNYGDEVNLSRVARILKNFKNTAFMEEVKNAKQIAHVISHEVRPDGIYARIKVRDNNE